VCGGPVCWFVGSTVLGFYFMLYITESGKIVEKASIKAYTIIL